MVLFIEKCVLYYYVKVKHVFSKKRSYTVLKNNHNNIKYILIPNIRLRY